MFLKSVDRGDLEGSDKRRCGFGRRAGAASGASSNGGGGVRGRSGGHGLSSGKGELLLTEPEPSALEVAPVGGAEQPRRWRLRRLRLHLVQPLQPRGIRGCPPTAADDAARAALSRFSRDTYCTNSFSESRPRLSRLARREWWAWPSSSTSGLLWLIWSPLCSGPRWPLWVCAALPGTALSSPLPEALAASRSARQLRLLLRSGELPAGAGGVGRHGGGREGWPRLGRRLDNPTRGAAAAEQ